MDKENKSWDKSHFVGDNSNEKLHISSFYECGRCKLVSKEHKEHMIENGMSDIVFKHIHLFEN